MELRTVYAFMHACIYVCIDRCMYVRMYVCKYVRMYACILYMYVCPGRVQNINTERV